MERDTPNRDRTADELRALGASEDFIEAYFTPFEGRHSIVEELDGGFGGSLIDNPNRDFRPNVGGGYFKKLWESGAETAWGHADHNNRKILTKANLVDGVRKV